MNTRYRLNTTAWDSPAYTEDVRLAQLVKDEYGDKAEINAVSYK